MQDASKNFSIYVLSSNLEALLGGNTNDPNILAGVVAFNRFKRAQDTFVVDRDTEDFNNVRATARSALSRPCPCESAMGHVLRLAGRHKQEGTGGTPIAPFLAKTATDVRRRISAPHGLSHDERPLLTEALHYMRRRGPCLFVSIEAGRAPGAERGVRGLARRVRSDIALRQRRADAAGAVGNSLRGDGTRHAEEIWSAYLSRSCQTAMRAIASSRA